MAEEAKPVEVAEEAKPIEVAEEAKPVEAAEEAKPVEAAEEAKPVEVAEAQANEEAEAAVEAEPAAAEGVEGERKEEEVKDFDEPVALGFKTFKNVVEMYEYFNDILNASTLDQDLNEYEYKAVVDLLEKGHASAKEKIGGGIESIAVVSHPEWGSRCFTLTRTDGSTEDFSYRKSIEGFGKLPEAFSLSASSKRRADGGGHGGGRGRGRGRGGGRGGRGGFKKQKVMEL